MKNGGAPLPGGKPWVAPWMRRIAKRLLRLRFLLLQRHRYNRLVLEQAGPFPLLVLPQVFNPGLFPSGAFLLHYLEDHPIAERSMVLDLGCGSGICGLAAAGAGAGCRVVCADVNPEAVRCARINLLMNGLSDRVETVESDLFAAFAGQRFDVVLFNPPFYRGEAARPIDSAWRATDTLERFAEHLGDHLTANGYSLVVFSTDGDLHGFLDAVAGAGLGVDLVAERDTINEILVLYRLRITNRRSPAAGT